MIRLLMDLSPDPPAVVGIGALILLLIVILGFAAILIVGFVLLLVWRKRRRANVAVVANGGVPQPSNPSQ